MPCTAAEAERFVDLALRMTIPIDDAIRHLMWRIGQPFDGATDRTPVLPMLVDARVGHTVALAARSARRDAMSAASPEMR